MLLTPVSTMKQRLARQWCKMQNNNRWTYEMKRVINNKPHIVLSTYTPERPQQQQTMPMMTLSSLFSGMQLPEESIDEMESEGSNTSNCGLRESGGR